MLSPSFSTEQNNFFISVLDWLVVDIYLVSSLLGKCLLLASPSLPEELLIIIIVNGNVIYDFQPNIDACML